MKKIDFKMKKLSILILGIMLSFPLFSQTEPMGDMFELAKMKSGMKNRRISSTDPTGGNRDHLEPFKPGEKRDMHRWRDAWRKAKGNDPSLWGNMKIGKRLFFS